MDFQLRHKNHKKSERISGLVEGVLHRSFRDHFYQLVADGNPEAMPLFATLKPYKPSTIQLAELFCERSSGKVALQALTELLAPLLPHVQSLRTVAIFHSAVVSAFRRVQPKSASEKSAFLFSALDESLIKKIVAQMRSSEIPEEFLRRPLASRLLKKVEQTISLITDKTEPSVDRDDAIFLQQLSKALICLASKKYRDAFEICEKTAFKNRKSERLSEYGMTLQVRGNAAWRIAESPQTKDKHFYYDAANKAFQVYLRNKNFPLASRYQIAVQQIEIRFSEAKVFISEKQPHKAEELYRDTIRMARGLWSGTWAAISDKNLLIRAKLAMASAAFGVKDFPEARFQLEQRANLFPKGQRPFAHLDAVRALHGAGGSEEALKSLEDIIGKDFGSRKDLLRAELLRIQILLESAQAQPAMVHASRLLTEHARAFKSDMQLAQYTCRMFLEIGVINRNATFLTTILQLPTYKKLKSADHGLYRRSIRKAEIFADFSSGKEVRKDGVRYLISMLKNEDVRPPLAFIRNCLAVATEKASKIPEASLDQLAIAFEGLRTDDMYETPVNIYANLYFVYAFMNRHEDAQYMKVLLDLCGEKQ